MISIYPTMCMIHSGNHTTYKDYIISDNSECIVVTVKKIFVCLASNWSSHL